MESNIARTRLPAPPTLPGLPALSPTMGFDEAAEAVLTFLDQRLPWGMWSVTRIENGKQTMLRVHDTDFGAEAGDSNLWTESFCIKMVSGEGPRVAPDVAKVPAYANQPTAQRDGIRAYAGAPISDNDGTLFGALCGINKTPVDASTVEDAPLLELLAQLLGMVLAADRIRDDIERSAHRARVEADTDSLTGVYSRRGWDALVALEEQRQQRFADPCVVIMIDLDGLKAINDLEGHAAGDDYLRRAAAALSSAVREADPVARLGGDEFGILLHDTSVEDAPKRVERFRAVLDAAGVSASLGWAPHTLKGGFAQAIHDSDTAMYADKSARRIARSVAAV